MNVSFVEVGPRDGLQNEKTLLSVEDKVEFVKRLALSGLKRVEVGSFVSPSVIPQMDNTEEVVSRILLSQNKKELPEEVQISALVPNLKGLERALSCHIKRIAVFAACTDSFSQKNLNCSVEKSFDIYKKVCKEALNEKLKIRGYLSVAFSCPYEGKISSDKVTELVERMLDLGIFEVSVSDTVGTARPFEVDSLLTKLFKRVSPEKISLHFHNVHGMAIGNALAAYKMGVRVFDGSVGGLGGCPYAGVPAGNVPTESLMYLFKGSANPVITELIKIGRWLEEKLKTSLPSPLIHSPYFK